MVAYLDQAGVQHLIAKIRDSFWPVGTILATSTSTSPASYLGGSWEAYAPGRTLVGVSTTDTDFTLNKQGGAKTFSLERDGIGAEIGVHSNGGLQWGYNHSCKYHHQFYFQDKFQIMTEHGKSATGVGLIGSVSTVQPYITVYYWRRIA